MDGDREISVCRVLSAAAASVRGDPCPHGKRKSQTAPDAGESARRDGGPGPAHAGRTTWGSQGQLGLWLTQPHGALFRLCSGSSKTHADGPQRAPRAPFEDNAGGFCCFQRATAAFSEHSNERQRHRPVWKEGKWKHKDTTDGQWLERSVGAPAARAAPAVPACRPARWPGGCPRQGTLSALPATEEGSGGLQAHRPPSLAHVHKAEYRWLRRRQRCSCRYPPSGLNLSLPPAP